MSTSLVSICVLTWVPATLSFPFCQEKKTVEWWYQTKLDFETIIYYGLAALPTCRHYKAAMSSQPKILIIAAFSLPSCYCRFLIFFVFFFQLGFDVRGGQNFLRNIEAQLNGTYFLGQTVKITILENKCNGFLSIFPEELAKQLTNLPRQVWKSVYLFQKVHRLMIGLKGA